MFLGNSDRWIARQVRSAWVLLLIAWGYPSYATDCESQPTHGAGIRCLEEKISALQVAFQKSVSDQSALGKTVAEMSSIPKGAVVPFELLDCPAGWTEYIPAQGRFIRGIDKTGIIDPEGKRAPGDLQQDQFAEHAHTRPAAVYDAGGGSDASWVASARNLGYGHQNPPNTGPSGKGNETRPKNVALLFCRKG